MKPKGFWQRVSRDMGRGWSATRHAYFTAPKITRWRFPYWALEPHPVPVHIVAGRDDWLCAAWTLVSFFLNTKQNWRVCVHDDGTLLPDSEVMLQRMFPNCRVLWRDASDTRMESALQSFPACAKWRGFGPENVNIFDMADASAGAPRFIALDCHTLFFKRPDELLDWADGDAMECWFPENAKPELQPAAAARLEPWGRAYPGLGLMVRKALDFSVCEEILTGIPVERRAAPSVNAGLWAACAAAYGPGGLLPRRYEVSQSRHLAATSVARCYTGQTASRFFDEGLPRLLPRLV